MENLVCFKREFRGKYRIKGKNLKKTGIPSIKQDATNIALNKKFENISMYKKAGSSYWHHSGNFFHHKNNF